MATRTVMSRRTLLAVLAPVALAACSRSAGRGASTTTTAGAGTTPAPESSGAAVSAAPVADAATSTSASATTTSPATSTTATTPSGDYFPPGSGEWETVSAAEAGFDADRLAALIELVGSVRSQSFVLLHEGRIVVEQYWNGADATWTLDVASCQKSVTSTLIGLARDRGLLALDDTVSTHLPAGWTRAAPADEEAITIRHLLTMSSGLDETTLTVKNPPGTVWEYNTVAYQKLRRVLEAAAGADINSLSAEWLFGPIGIDRADAWSSRGGPADAAGDALWGLHLSGREMARFGLLAMRNGQWDGTQITDAGWFAEAWTSTPLKADYGYLWWLLGKGHLGRAGAPPDLVAALGASDQKIYVAPDLGMVLTRQGDAAKGEALAESDFDAALVRALVSARA